MVNEYNKGKKGFRRKLGSQAVAKLEELKAVIWSEYQIQVNNEIIQSYIDFISELKPSKYAIFLFDTDLAALSIVKGKPLTIYVSKDISLLIPWANEDYKL